MGLSIKKTANRQIALKNTNVELGVCSPATVKSAVSNPIFMEEVASGSPLVLDPNEVLQSDGTTTEYHEYGAPIVCDVCQTFQQLTNEATTSEIVAAIATAGETDNVKALVCSPIYQMDFTESATSIEVGDSLTLTDSSPGSPTYWQWLLKSGSNVLNSSLQNPSLIPSEAGTYDIRLAGGNAVDGFINKVKASRLSVAPYSFRNALSFDGVNDEVSLGTINYPGEWTMQTWFKSSQGSIKVFMGGGLMGVMQIDNGKLRINQNNVTATGTIAINTNVWRHLVVSFKNMGSSYSLFAWVDGVLDIYSTGRVPYTPVVNFDLGRSISAGFNTQCFMDDPALWIGYAANGVDALTLYNGGLGAPPTLVANSNLYFWLKLDETIGKVSGNLTDVKGNVTGVMSGFSLPNGIVLH